MQAASEAESGAALTRRESRRIAELIVRSSRSRAAMERPSRGLVGLSVGDARIIRDDVVRLSLASGHTVRLICAHPSGEPTFVGGEMLSYGSARILNAEDRLTVSVLAGVRGPVSRLSSASATMEGLAIAYGVVVTRQPYGAAEVAVEDLICANGGVLHAAVTVPTDAGEPGGALEIERESGGRLTVSAPDPAALVVDARELLRDADASSTHPSEIQHALDAESGTVTVLGTALTEPLSLDPGSSLSLRAAGAELLKVTADLGHFI